MSRFCKIEEITNLRQLDQLLDSCRAIPTGEPISARGFYSLKGQKFLYPDGKTQYREYIEKRAATVVVPEDPDGKLIMVIQPVGLAKEGSLIEFPAGYAEAGEDGMATGVREMLEETGLATAPENITDLGCHYQDPGLVPQPVHAYLAEDCEQIRAPQLDEGEYIQLYKVRKALLFEMLRAGYIKDSNTYFAAIQALFGLGILSY